MLVIWRDVRRQIQTGNIPSHHAVNLPAHHAESTQMLQATSAKTVTYTLTESEIIAYYDLLTRRQARSTGRPRSMLSTIYIPMLLGAILIALRAGHADFGPMLVAGTIAYLGGVLALRHEVLQSHSLRLTEISRAEPLYLGQRHVTLGDDALEWSTPGISARFDYSAFTDFEVSQGFILGWLGNAGATPLPIRAFASTGEADAFASDMRSRIVAARSGEAGRIA
jgi:hypothetical protein